MSLKALELGISALQRGQTEEGTRLIRIALKGGDLTGEMRAIAYLWMAEAQADPSQRRAMYSAAVQADPANQDARQRLNAVLTQELPPAPVLSGMSGTAASPASTPASTPSRVNVADHVARIIGGPNGPGTGVFVSESLVATTRFVIGENERVTVEVHPTRQLPALVVRAFSELDLALIRVDHRPMGSLPITPYPRVPDDAPLTAVSFSGEMVTARQRPTNRVMEPHWIPTTITQVSDAGGDPLFDAQTYLVGILTKNTSRASAHFYGLHISAIRRAVQTYLGEASERRVYCVSCGSASRAGGMGYYYCETCGGVLPFAQAMSRYPLPQAEPFYGSGGVRCTRCGASAGFYAGHCLRCGQPPATTTI